jgi:hypothetical protein
MVLDCKNDPGYNMVYTPTEKDYFLYSTFINLFYLQYVNKEMARLKASELVNNSNIDDRIKNLAHQLLDSAETIRRKPLLETKAKVGRIISHLYKKYIAHSKAKTTAAPDVAFKEIIKNDWWQN